MQSETLSAVPLGEAAWPSSSHRQAGAFGVGFLAGWNPDPETDFVGVSGTSAGALIAPFAFPGAYDVLRNASIVDGDKGIYRWRSKLVWPFRDSATRTWPLRERIHTYLTAEEFEEIMNAPQSAPPFGPSMP